VSHRHNDPLPNDGERDVPVTVDISEPADPDDINHATRRDIPLAPDSVKPDGLPEPFVEDGEPVTVAEAGVTYLKVQRANWNDDALTSKHERHKDEIYPRILEADRHFQREYDGLTTAMLTRRLSPLNETGSWLTPWDCNGMLHGGGIQRSVREALDYRLGEFIFEWVAVTAPTRSAGTPHEHIYLWIDDADDEVTVDHLSPALDKHLKHCENAYQEHHRYQADGTEGAVTIRHDPPVVTEYPESLSEILEHSSPHPNTLGALYLATQLPHLHISDYYAENRDTPPQALFEGAALAWVSPRNWFRASQGVPAL
jgi:hypothetical protein